MRLAGRTGADDRDLDQADWLRCDYTRLAGVSRPGRAVVGVRRGIGEGQQQQQQQRRVPGKHAGALCGLLSDKLALRRPVVGQWRTIFSQGRCQFLPRAPIVRSPRDR